MRSLLKILVVFSVCFLDTSREVLSQESEKLKEQWIQRAEQAKKERAARLSRYAGEPLLVTEKSREFEKLADQTSDLYKKLIDSAIKIVKKMPEKPDQLAQEQLSAIFILGQFRVWHASPHLVRLIMIKPPKRGHSFHNKGKRRVVLRKLMNDYPAAKALRKIGLQGVRAILEDVSSHPPKDDENGRLRLALYAEVLILVLGSEQAKVFIEVEKSQGSDEKAANYDVLLKAVKDWWKIREKYKL